MAGFVSLEFRLNGHLDAIDLSDGRSAHSAHLFMSTIFARLMRVELQRTAMPVQQTLHFVYAFQRLQTYSTPKHSTQHTWTHTHTRARTHGAVDEQHASVSAADVCMRALVNVVIRFCMHSLLKPIGSQCNGLWRLLIAAKPIDKRTRTAMHSNCMSHVNWPSPWDRMKILENLYKSTEVFVTFFNKWYDLV